MQNRTSVREMALGERIVQGLRAHQIAIEYFVYLVTGFISANAFVLGGLAPFGVAFAASSKQKYHSAATLGATLGYLISFSVEGNLKYILAMLILFAMRKFFQFGGVLHQISISGQFCLILSLGIPSFAVTIASGGNVYDLVFAGSELLLACCASYFFTRTVQAFDLGIENMKQNDITSIIITFCITILALVNLNFFGLSIGRIIAVLVILLSAQMAREAGGAIAGVAAGVSAGILGGQYGFLMGTYGFGGLLAGVFAPLGRIASAGAFILVNTFALLASREQASSGLMLEIFIAAVLSMLVPTTALRRLVCRQPTKPAVHPNTYKNMLIHKIQYISNALRDVADTTRQVNDKISGMVSGDISSVYQCAADKVCRKCRNQMLCWQQRYNDTSNVLNSAMETLKKTNHLEESDFPDYFAQSCLHLPQLTEQLRLLFAEYIAREQVRRKVAQVRGVVTDQFEGMALMIDAMGHDLDSLAEQDNQTAGKVKEYMHRLSIFPDNVTCTVDRDANMTLEMTLPTYKFSRIDAVELTVALSDICGRDFDYPMKHERAGEAVTHLRFIEKATYTVKWGASQIGNSGSKLCGDSYSYVDSRSGRVNVILSDGMGSGGSAAVDSTMTSELLKRLIEAGVSLDASLKLVNSALLIKSGDESLATIDITGIDLYSGKVEFYKAGAAPTFLRKSGRGGYVESRSLPVGILGGVSFEKNAVTLRAGDWVVMTSDGAVCSGYDWIVSDLEHYEGDDPKELSEQIATEAKRRRNDGHEDDITVISIRIEKGI